MLRTPPAIESNGRDRQVISFAQNGEDVVLARALGAAPTGRYIDVGAGDPEIDSVTLHFYNLGWRGINIEPQPARLADLERRRPEDINLGCAVGAEPGELQLTVPFGERSTMATLNPALASSYTGEHGWPTATMTVTVRTLTDIVKEYPGEIDFLKIDVEGYELAVLQGCDWSVVRPRVIVVEATVPGSAVTNHQEWEPILLEAGYACALFDGLNRYYARADDPELLARLAAPANVLDNFMRRDFVRASQRADSLERELAATVARHDKLAAQLAEYKQRQQALKDRVRSLQARNAQLKTASAGSRSGVAATGRRLVRNVKGRLPRL